jgi:hypothetical protein
VRYLALVEVLEIYRRIIQQSGDLFGVRVQLTTWIGARIVETKSQ